MLNETLRILKVAQAVRKRGELRGLVAAAAVALARAGARARAVAHRLELLEAAARADRDAGQRRLGEVRRHVRFLTKPLVEALKAWVETTLARLPGGATVAQALRYGLNHWDGLVRFLDDGRIEIDSNTVSEACARLPQTRANALPTSIRRPSC